MVLIVCQGFQGLSEFMNFWLNFKDFEDSKYFIGFNRVSGTLAIIGIHEFWPDFKDFRSDLKGFKPYSWYSTSDFKDFRDFMSDCKVFKLDFRYVWPVLTDFREYRDYRNCKNFRDSRVYRVSRDFRLDFRGFRSEFRTFVQPVSEVV